MAQKIFNNKLIKILLGLILILYLYSLWGRVPDIDDAWIGEHAYWLATEGIVKSELMRGITLQEEYLIVDHKLLTLHGAAFIKMFGFSLYTLKSVSLFYFIAFLAVFILYTYRWRNIFDKNSLYLALLIIMIFPWSFKYSFLFRPEVMIMFFGFLVYILSEKFLKDGNRHVYVLLAGLISGLSFVTHLNGIIVIGAGFLLLIWNRSWKGAAVYSLGTIVGLSLYFYDFNSDHGMTLWLMQFNQSPALDSLDSIPLVLQPFINLITEPLRYFHNLKITFFSLLMIVSIAGCFPYLYKKDKNLSRFAFLLLILTGMIAMHKSRQYILIALPYLAILLTYSIRTILDNSISSYYIKTFNSRILSIIIGLLFLAYIISGFYINSELSLEKFNKDDNYEISMKYAEDEVSNMNIIAPMTFIFNEIENYNRIQGEVCYTEMQKADPSIKGEGFIKKANSYDISLIILSPFYQRLLEMDSLAKNEYILNFKVVEKTDELLILNSGY